MRIRQYFRLVGLSVLIALSGVMTTSAGATDLEWNAANDWWPTASSWSPNQEPTASDRAYIRNGGTCKIGDDCVTAAKEVYVGGSSNTGTLENMSELTVEDMVVGNSAYDGSFSLTHRYADTRITDLFKLGSHGNFDAVAGSDITFHVTGGNEAEFEIDTTDGNDVDGLANCAIICRSGDSSTSNRIEIECAGKDTYYPPAAGDFTAANFVINKLSVGSTNPSGIITVELTDDDDNQGDGSQQDALYVNTLEIHAGATFQLGTRNIYYKNGGSVKQFQMGDTDLDGVVGILDLGTVADNYGETSGMSWADGDFDGDGDVDILDHGVVSSNYDPTYSISAANISTDSSGSPALSDCQVHFSHKDATGNCAYRDLYIKLSTNTGRSGRYDWLKYKVKSVSDPNGIDVYFIETGPATKTFLCEEPIHLATASNQSTLELKVLDEEMLTVNTTDVVKVDRGEIATITIEFLYWKTGEPYAVHQDYADPTADEVHEYFSKDEPNNTHYWWSGGEERAQTPGFNDFVKNAGNTSLSFPADMIFECSHGTGNIGTDGYDPNQRLYRPGIGETPTIDPNDWQKDIEWAILYSCNVLEEHDVVDPNRPIQSDFTEDWDDALIQGSGPSHCHGLLTSNDLLGTAPGIDHMSYFCSNLDGNDTVIDAYMDGASSASQDWAAALFHYDNRLDTLSSVTADTNDPTMYFVYNCSGQQTDTWEATLGLPDAPSPASAAELSAADNEQALKDIVFAGKQDLLDALNDQDATIACAIPVQARAMAKLRVRKSVPDVAGKGPRGFGKAKRSDTGRLRLRKAARTDWDCPIAVTGDEAQVKAEAFVNAHGGLPDDAELAAVTLQKAATYEAGDREATWQERILKAYLEYRHKFNGVEIVGGRKGDSIRVGIQDDEVVTMDRHWRTIEGPAGESQSLIPAVEALAVAVENVPKVFLGPITGYSITEIKPFYHGAPSELDEQELVPAWGFCINGGHWVYVDALTGEFLP